MAEKRYYINEKHEIVDKKGIIPPIKVDFQPIDENLLKRCDTYTLLHHLNRQEILLNYNIRWVDALIKAFNDEKDKASGELKKALERIGNTELEI